MRFMSPKMRCVGAVAFAAACSAVFARSTVDLNRGWEFAPDGWDGPAHRVDLPHDFQMEMPWLEKAGGLRGFKPMGAARYRKTFVTAAAWAGERVFLDFEGIMCVGDVWVNGAKVASSEYGYLGFEVDVTRRLKAPGGTNTVEVWASTGWVGGSRWYTGGGLYRPVRLRTRPVRSIARHGLFVTTPEVSATGATVRVQVELDGFRCTTNGVEAVAEVRGPDGAVAGTSRCAVPYNDYRSRVMFTLPEIRLASPALWDVDAPRLYAVEVRLLEAGRVIDADRTTFGVRHVEFSPAFGFRLNGRKVSLKSMSNHSDYGAVGVAQYPRAIERELRQMKAFGFNAVRCSHNPYAADFYRLADELGVLVVDELVDKWSRGASCWMGRRPFLELWPELITEWVRRDRNHPSVVLWSLGNELQQNETFSGYDTGDWGVTTYRIFDTFTKRLDPTRLTTVGLFPARAGAIQLKDPRFREKPLRPPELADVMDVASFNYLYADYGAYLERNPQMILFQSEASTSRWLEPYLKMDRARTVGVSWWGAIEYWGESNRWPKKGWNYSFFTHALEPKPQAYLIRSGLVAEEPLVRLGVMADAGESLVWNDIHSGQYVLKESWSARGAAQRRVFVFSNADEVELLLNGRSLGRKRTAQNVAEWRDVAYAPGRLEARGSNGASHALETAGPAMRLEIVEEAPGDWRADGLDLKYVRLYAQDAAGRRVPDASPLLRVRVEGAARLLALDDGDHFTDGHFDVSEKRMAEGFLLAILRSGDRPGTVTLHVEGEGLEPASATFAVGTGTDTAAP